MNPSKTIDWIALNLLPGLGPISLGRALERYGDPAEIAFDVPVEELCRLRPLNDAGREELREARRTLRRRAERELKLADKRGIRVVPRADPDYPAALVELPDAPILLYQRGELTRGVLRLAVIGSRTPTQYGKRMAAGLAGGLAARGVEVVSGGARGIDCLAHKAALEEGGRTVAVLGSGLMRPYPEENAGLFDRIAGGGAVLSEFALEEAPKSENFPRRNRLISGLAAAVVVVEAARRSGSLSTASHALDQGRDVMALPGPVDSHKSVGCNRLIQQGAKLVQNIGDILDELPPLFVSAVGEDPVRAAAAAPPELEGLTEDERDVIGIVTSTEPVQLDRLADSVPFGIARLQTALFGLEIRGAVEQCPGRYYVLRPKKES